MQAPAFLRRRLLVFRPTQALLATRARGILFRCVSMCSVVLHRDKAGQLSPKSGREHRITQSGTGTGGSCPNVVGVTEIVFWPTQGLVVRLCPWAACCLCAAGFRPRAGACLFCVVCSVGAACLKVGRRALLSYALNEALYDSDYNAARPYRLQVMRGSFFLVQVRYSLPAYNLTFEILI